MHYIDSRWYVLHLQQGLKAQNLQMRIWPDRQGRTVAESKSWLIWLEENGTYKNKRHIVSPPHVWLHDSHKLDRVKYLVFGTQHDYFLHHPKRLSKLQKIMLEEREQRWVTKISANFQDYRERKKEILATIDFVKDQNQNFILSSHASEVVASAKKCITISQ